MDPVNPAAAAAAGDEVDPAVGQYTQYLEYLMGQLLERKASAQLQVRTVCHAHCWRTVSLPE